MQENFENEANNSLAEESAKNAIVEFFRLSEFMVAKVAEILNVMSLKLSVAESCTGGLLGASLTQLSGASAWFQGGIISYHNDIKESHLHVLPSTLEKHGAVSPLTVCQMAMGATKQLKTELSLSVSGIAGPDGGTEEKPVGSVWLGIALPDNISNLLDKHEKQIASFLHNFSKDDHIAITSFKILQQAFFTKDCQPIKADNTIIKAREFCFAGDRASIRQSAVLMSLYLLYQELTRV